MAGGTAESGGLAARGSTAARRRAARTQQEHAVGRRVTSLAGEQSAEAVLRQLAALLGSLIPRVYANLVRHLIVPAAGLAFFATASLGNRGMIYLRIQHEREDWR
ncbi:hypothetical protein ERY13_33915 [Paenibacillus mucilaginosus]|uniref:hypothetical protein n=1 Tax=Paenibacillus mucilaginosus TaxID=61624 RepID=UPI00240DF659|nr:hypothetical protein [Paenibacillus mucilaginosus]WFA21841.1 hypothetical protein ERY13_33915 [Paenibacillus mucilaginosus]